MALTSDGKLYGWGQNQTGQLGVGGSFSMDVYAMEEYPVPINTDAVTREGNIVHISILRICMFTYIHAPKHTYTYI